MDSSSPKFAAIMFLLRCGLERQGILRVVALACFLVLAGMIAPRPEVRKNYLQRKSRHKPRRRRRRLT